MPAPGIETRRPNLLIAGMEAVRRRHGHRLPRGSRRLAALARPHHAFVSELFPRLRVPVDLAQPLQRQVWLEGDRYESPTIPILRQWLDDADRFFDIGANFGCLSWAVLSASPTVEVHAFEPIPAMGAVLEDVRGRNHLDRFHVEAIGLSDRPDTLPLLLIDEELAHSTFGDHPAYARDAITEARVDTFDRWRASAGLTVPDSPRWIAKIDVEGYEPRVLDGMAEALDAHAFLGVVVELNEYTLNFCGATTADVVERLLAAGYDRVVPAGAENHANGFFRLRN